MWSNSGLKLNNQTAENVLANRAERLLHIYTLRKVKDCGNVEKKRAEMRGGEFFCGANERVREGDVGERAQRRMVIKSEAGRGRRLLSLSPSWEPAGWG